MPFAAQIFFIAVLGYIAWEFYNKIKDNLY